MVLSADGASNAIEGLMRNVAGLLLQNGLTVEFFDVSRSTSDEWSRLARLLMSGTVAFGVSFLGVGYDFEVKMGKAADAVNVWDHTNVPLIKLHGDTPAYFLRRHLDVPLSGVNAYYFDEHLEFQRWVRPEGQSIAAMIDPFLISDTALATADFAARKRGTLVFVKNGGDPRELMSLWRQQLSESVSDQLIELAIEMTPRALKTGRFLVHEHVIDYLATKRIDPRGLRELVRLYTAQLDDYVRRVKSTMVAQALLPLPVIIQGAKWEHLDLTGAKAQVRPPLDFVATESVFQRELGVIDLSPNVDGASHDRMCRAAGAYAFGLTNKSSWLGRLVPELNARAYEFDPESIAASAAHALGNPSECVALAEAYGTAFRKRYESSAFVDRFITLADMARLRATHPRPVLQPYFVW